MTIKESDIVNQAIASRVHSFRKDNRLSLDELAKRADISKGMVVQIEKGRANPSIGLLCKLANALGVSLADIVAVSDEPKVIIRHQHDIPTLWHGDKGGTARLLAGTKGSVMIELWRWIMLPGEIFTSDAHSKNTMELIHVEEGSLAVEVNNETFTLNANDAMTAQMDVPHSYSNTSDSAVTFTMTVYEKSSQG
ncbi:transcriptional regulator, XRE family with cupin sensor [Pseudidiomarina planktonica]|uniref:Transcriptional regulator, XRE family with cupin sensor n=1 Tax=Pseudidiomarina planktonica TaxID=1323738 RepID=A0A1Y6G330_9GAMM|nr:helix-turn-helix transcriptional regulator [Pseudidiomarina planktonica]RUO63947.1 XRE family transcriptional regulator [Pseudidiomarina planktonica]SMQ79969.1 transcriptional regulator, XRE family with cupin sensor [Pseudidiomarina planktonica]